MIERPRLVPVNVTAMMLVWRPEFSHGGAVASQPRPTNLVEVLAEFEVASIDDLAMSTCELVCVKRVNCVAVQSRCLRSESTASIAGEMKRLSAMVRVPPSCEA